MHSIHSPEHPTTPSPPLRPISGLERAICSTLEKLLILPEAGGQRRSFDPIFRSAAGGSWRTLHQCLDPAAAAALVVDPRLILGLRHRHWTRLVVIDIDNHGGRPSPYWHPDGPDASPALQRLLRLAEAAGCASAVFRTPSGGWHLWLALPEPLQHATAAHLGIALVRRAGLQVAPGLLEVFPSVTGWSTATDARHRPRSHGFRLPGQAGGAVWLGGSIGWSSEPEDCWREALAAAELAEATDEWPALVAEAESLRRIANPRRRPAAGTPSHRHQERDPGIVWSGPGQTNTNLGRLANALYRPGEDRETFASRIEAAALTSPGFERHASADTRRRLSQWCRDWAACCHRRPPAALGDRRPASADPGRNLRLRREAAARVIDCAKVIAREHGPDALQWSERVAAAAIGMARATFRKLKRLFFLRLTAALYAPPSARGLHPPAKGLGHSLPLQGPAVRSAESPSLHPVPPVASRLDRPPPAPPPAVPIAPARESSPRRERERLELARWLAAAA